MSDVSEKESKQGASGVDWARRKGASGPLPTSVDSSLLSTQSILYGDRRQRIESPLKVSGWLAGRYMWW